MKRQLITLDFETYFSSTLGFASHTTQEYVMHPDFEVIMVGIAVDDDEPQWFPKEQVAEALALIDWDNVDLLCQNTNFDGSILAWHYGHVPARYMDTMAMAACTGVARLARGASLATQAKFMQEQGYDIPSKGNETVNAKGLLRNQFSHAQLQSYANYCMDDVRITRALWRIYQEYITEGELDWHDMVIRMFTLPQFQLDKVTIKQELERVVTRRKIVQHEVMRQLHLTDDKAFLSVIMSNPKFASALENFGCIPPKKISKRTGKETFAFARTDEGMLGLLEHTNENVRALAEARLGLKSSIEVTRCEKFLKLAELGAFAMPYRVSGAASHRLSGCVVADTMIVCLTVDGAIVEKPIVDVLISDLVWDGIDFVEHEGVAYRGRQEVFEWDGVTGTANHPVYIEENKTVGLRKAKETGTPIVAAAAPPDWEYNAGRLRKMGRK